MVGQHAVPSQTRRGPEISATARARLRADIDGLPAIRVMALYDQIQAELVADRWRLTFSWDGADAVARGLRFDGAPALPPGIGLVRPASASLPYHPSVVPILSGSSTSSASPTSL